MSDVSREKIEQALDKITDPHLNMSLLAAKALQDVKIDESGVTIDLCMPYPCLHWADTLSAMVSEGVQEHAGVGKVCYGNRFFATAY